MNINPEDENAFIYKTTDALFPRIVAIHACA